MQRKTKSLVTSIISEEIIKKLNELGLDATQIQALAFLPVSKDQIRNKINAFFRTNDDLKTILHVDNQFIIELLRECSPEKLDTLHRNAATLAHFQLSKWQIKEIFRLKVGAKILDSLTRNQETLNALNFDANQICNVVHCSGSSANLDALTKHFAMIKALNISANNLEQIFNLGSEKGAAILDRLKVIYNKLIAKGYDNDGMNRLIQQANGISQLISRINSAIKIKKDDNYILALLLPPEPAPLKRPRVIYEAPCKDTSYENQKKQKLEECEKPHALPQETPRDEEDNENELIIDEDWEKDGLYDNNNGEKEKKNSFSASSPFLFRTPSLITSVKEFERKNNLNKTK